MLISKRACFERPRRELLDNSLSETRKREKEKERNDKSMGGTLSGEIPSIRGWRYANYKYGLRMLSSEDWKYVPSMLRSWGRQTHQSRVSRDHLISRSRGSFTGHPLQHVRTQLVFIYFHTNCISIFIPNCESTVSGEAAGAAWGTVPGAPAEEAAGTAWGDIPGAPARRAG